jgi:hypothetical protein
VWSTAHTGTKSRVCSGPGTGPFPDTVAGGRRVIDPYSIGRGVEQSASPKSESILRLQNSVTPKPY